MAYLTSHRLPVLLVDYEPPLQRGASVLLRASGIADVLTLEDSPAMLPLLAEQPVGVLVLDLTRKPCGARTATRAWRPGCWACRARR